MRTHFANRFSTTLTAAMGATALEASVLTTAGSPISPCYLVIDHDVPASAEIILFDGLFDGTTFRTLALANRYLDGSAAASGLTHAAGAKVISAPLGTSLNDIWDQVDAHAALTNPHSATSSATANRLILRDASGRAQVASPSAVADIATKGYVDSLTPIGVQVFTASGNWNKPVGAKSVRVQVQGGGAAGSGGSGGSGGGGGGYAEKMYDAASLGSSVTVTVGAASAASSFDTVTGSGSVGNNGATASGGDLNITGQSGGAGAASVTGHGGSSILGFGGAQDREGDAGKGYGAGGTGGGGAGAPGVVIVTTYF